jgi:hypothetical protein
VGEACKKIDYPVQLLNTKQNALIEVASDLLCYTYFNISSLIILQFHEEGNFMIMLST